MISLNRVFIKTHEIYDEELADYMLVETATAKMRTKLDKKRGEGREGWHHPNYCSNNSLIAMLKEHVEKGDMIDVMNLAAMIDARNELYGEKTTND